MLLPLGAGLEQYLRLVRAFRSLSVKVLDDPDGRPLFHGLVYRPVCGDRLCYVVIYLHGHSPCRNHVRVYLSAEIDTSHYKLG